MVRPAHTIGLWGVGRRLRLTTMMAAVLAAGLLAGCATERGLQLTEAIERGFPGHVELSPKLAVGADTGAFPYTPGTLIFAAASDDDGTAWVAQTDLRCGHPVPISRLRSMRLDPYVLASGVSISARDRARRWLTRNTGLSLQAVAGVASVRIALTNVHRIAPGPSDLARLRQQASQGCPLAGVPGWQSVAAVLIGDVRVDVRFERGISLQAKLALLEQLQVSFGVGYRRISDRSILGRQVAFAVKWQ